MTGVAIEEDLEFDFRKARRWQRLDGPDHGLSHCMKAVDFIVETDRRLLFIEVKDPDNPAARAKGSKEVEQFEERLQSGRLIRRSLVPKCRDSFLHQYAADRIGKPIVYVVLLALSSLTEPALMTLGDLLKRELPVSGPRASPWPKPFVTGCVVANLATWGRVFPKFPVRRLSRGGR